MNNIYVSHISNSLNYGTAMMGINLISNIKTNGIIYTDTNDEYHLKRYESEIKNNKMYKINIYNHNNFIINIFFNLVNIYKMKYKYKIKYHIILGGDDLSEYYSGKYIVFELINLYIMSKFLTIILVGQTIGPFYKWRKNVFKILFKNIIIFTRDHITYKELIEQYNLNKVYEYRDLALLDLPNQNINKERLLSKYNLKKNKYIVIIISGLYNKYINNLDIYLECFNKIINYLKNEKKLKNYDIVFMPHVIKKGKINDLDMINNYKNKYKDDIIYIEDILLPSEARYILGNSFFSISGRMHGNINTLQMGKPSIALSYSKKFYGVIGDGLDLNDLLIEAKGDDIWESGKIIEIVKEKIDYIINNYEVLGLKIKKSIKQNKILAQEQINEVNKIINS